jgi:hypothetical protein
MYRVVLNVWNVTCRLLDFIWYKPEKDTNIISQSNLLHDTYVENIMYLSLSNTGSEWLLFSTKWTMYQFIQRREQAATE